MFGNNYNHPFGYNSMPTATQPYGYPMGMGPTQGQYNTQTQQAPMTNTNKVYVNGIEDVRNKQLPPGSDFIYLDNDKPLLYQKIVNGSGQFEVKAFTITPYEPQEKVVPQVDLSNYVKVSDLDPIKEELKLLKEKLTPTEVSNGPNTTSKSI